MDEDEPSWIGKLQPFGSTEAAQWEVWLGRCHKLGQALWGRTPDDLREQLQRSHPNIPIGFDLADYQLLLRESSRIASMNLDDPRNAWARRILSSTQSLSVGTQTFTEWEARVEIVRRAIEYFQLH